MKFIYLYLVIIIVIIQAVSSNKASNKKKNETHEKRIVGGSLANITNFEYQVLLVGLIPNSTNAYLCGGSILTEKYVVTAAHCVDKTLMYYIKAGTSYIYDTSTGQVSAVQEATIHPEYDSNLQGIALNDIAILKLEKSLVFNSKVGPVRLPAPNSDANLTIAQVSGWGNTNSNSSQSSYLMYANVSVISNAACQQALNSFGAVPDLVKDTHICTLESRPFKGACNGDSGGPLVQNGELIGTVSWALLPCDTEGGPTVYTRVSKFVPWIQETMKK